MVGFPIDFVVLWVDGGDKSWIEKKNSYKAIDEQMNTNARFRDYGIFKYWFRSVEINAPWVNKIHLITDNQVPNWLKKSDKINIVDHTSFIPEEFLPTFNSNVIESNVHRIEGLAEHFVLFNDDLFVFNKVTPEDFFDDSGQSKDIFALNIIQPTDHYSHIFVQNMTLINKTYKKNDVIKKNFSKFFNFKYGRYLLLNLYLIPFNTFTRFFDPHLATAFSKSDLERMWQMFGDQLYAFQKNRFRQPDDYSVYLARYIRLAEGDFSPVTMKNRGTYFSITDTNRINQEMHSSNKFVVLNDDDQIDENKFELVKSEVNDLMEEKFPNKSRYER